MSTGNNADLGLAPYVYIYTLNVSCIMLVYYFAPFIVNNRYLLF
jgi:hypothetical protein